MRRCFVGTLATFALLLASCSDGSSSDNAEPKPDRATTTTVAPPTTDPAAMAKAYVDPGPYPVGVATLALPSGPEVEVWYPAVKGTTGTVSYDVRDFVPPAIKKILTADIPATFEFEGKRDAEVAAGKFPVVLFSHGFSGFRLQSSFLTSHLASYGMVVVAPDHPSRSLAGVLGGGAAPGGKNDSVDELLGSLELIEAQSNDEASPFNGHIDGTRVAALGHSAGGGTILGAALDDRVDGYVSMASGGPADEAAFPDRPSFFLAGALDGVISAQDRTLPAFEAAPAPSRYWEIESVGHNGFDDFCTFGGGTGIIGIAEASGLGGLLEAQPQLAKLGQDGCVKPAAPVEEAFPIIRHGVTAWLRWLFKEDPKPVGLDVDANWPFELKVTSKSK